MARTKSSKKKANAPKGGQAQMLNMSRQITEPAARGTIVRNRTISLKKAGDVVQITHCEPYFTVSQAALGAYQYNASPCAPYTFTYLQGLAQNFSKYRFRKLEFIYIPYSPTSTPGEFAMGLTYDRTDPVATSTAQIEQMSHGTSGPIWGGSDGTRRLHSNVSVNGIIIDVDTSRFDKTWYLYASSTIFTGMPTASQNIYCPCTLQIATFGGPAAANTLAGKIFVKYTVDLVEPVPPAIS